MKAVVVFGWAALVSIPLTWALLIIQAASYIYEGRGLNPYLAGAVGVSLLAAGILLAKFIDRFEQEALSR